jgi:hypothetical protein
MLYQTLEHNDPRKWIEIPYTRDNTCEMQVRISCNIKTIIWSVELEGKLKILIQEFCVLHLFAETAIPYSNNTSKAELMNDSL